MDGSKNRLEALTGVRFIAAFFVLAFHLWAVPKPGEAIPFWRFGHIGVSFFFVLSGFILGYNYLERADSIRPGAFYWARFARIYPVYLLGALLALVNGWREFGFGGSVGPFVFTLPMIQAWFPPYALSGNSVGWSLSVEAFFYALFPWAARRVARLNVRGAALVLVGCGVAFFAPFLVGSLLPGVGFRAVEGFMWANRFFPLLRVHEFVAGLALARVYALRPPRGAAPTLDLLAVATGGAIYVVAMSRWRLSEVLVSCGALVAPFCVMVYVLAANKGLFGRILGSRPFVLLGEASYALYVLHLGLSYATPRALKAHGPAFVTVFAIAVSVLVFLVYEKWARDALLRVARLRRGELAAGRP